MTSPVDDFRQWQRRSEAEISARQEHARLETERAVVRSGEVLMLRGMSLDDAGDLIIKTFGWGSPGGVHFTPDAVRSVLLAMGWRPKRARSKRGAA